MADEYPMTPSEYFRQQQEKADEAVKRAALIASQPLSKTPDEYAQSARLAKSVALPTAVIDPNYKTFAQKMTEKRNEMILSTAPVLTDWISKDDNHRLAADDLENMSWFEGFGRGAWNTVKRAGQRLDVMANQYALEQTAGRARDRKLTLGQLIDDERDVIKGKSGAEHKMLVGPSDVFSGFARWVDAKYADLISTDDEGAARDYAARLDAGRKALAATPKSQIATSFERDAMVDGAGLGDTLSNFGRAVAKNPIGALSWSLETAGESAPTLIGAAGATAVTRNPNAGIAVLGMGSYATERYTSPAEFFQEKGLDLSKREDVARLIGDPALLKEAKERGVIRGAVIGAFDAVSGGVAGKALAKNPLVEALAQGVAQAVTGSAGELTARLAAGQKLDWNEIVAEGFAEMATTPVDMGIAGRKFVRDRDAAKAATAQAGDIEALSSSAQASALRARMPDSFREYLDQALADGPVENVFVPAQDFVEYFQGQGVDPWDMTDDLDGVSRDDLDAALAGGGDLQIPTATYAAKIAGSEADPFFMENMRFSPDAMTAREAVEFNARASDAMQEAWDEAERMRVEDDALRGVEERIYTEMQSRLRQAGRTTDVANSEAMLYPAFYRVMAERSGLTTDEFLARYPLPRVEGVRPEGMQTKDVSAFNRTIAEARMPRRKVKAGQSLLEFIAERGGINDPGGELKARDAQVVKRGKGKKNLRLARDMAAAGQGAMFGGGKAGIGYGVDDVAYAAIEAGFMADNPDVLAYKEAIRSGGEVPDIARALWDAIDRELRGDAQYSADVQDTGEADANEALDQIEEYLASLGVSLDNSDEEILAAVRQDEEGRRYGQGEALPETIDVDGVARPTTNSEGQPLASTEAGVRAFWNWFGDSKVVDAQGKPLVVYHGTQGAEFDGFKPGSWFSENSSESSAYTFASDIPKRDKATGKYRIASGAEFAGQRVPYGGILSDIDGKVVGGVYATDSGVYRMLDGGKWEVFSDLVDDYDGFDYDSMTVVLRRGDFEAKAEEIVREYEGFVERAFPGGNGGRVYPVYLSLQNPITLDPLEANRIANRVGMSNDGIAGKIAEYTSAGYDGIETVSDEASVFSEVREALGGVPRQFVAFDPTQIKSINNRGTFDPNDARILYQGDRANDQPLYVVHNLSADKLRHAAGLGGLAAPSLAVARGDIGFDGFGEISLIGDHSLANPKGKGVRLFNADVYSPRQPRARFRVNDKARSAMRKFLAPAAEKIGLDIDRQRIGQDDIERGGLSEVEMTDAAKAAWLESKGEALPIVYQEAQKPEPVAGWEDFRETDRDELLASDAFINALRESYTEVSERSAGNPDRLMRINLRWLDESGEVSAASDMAQDLADRIASANSAIADFKPGLTDKIDTYRTSEALTQAIGDRMPEYRDWVREQFGDVVGPAFFENEAGRKRDYTLTNLVREMTRTIRNGENWNYGAGNVRAAVAPEFRTIGEVKDARGQITSDAEMEALKGEVNDELFALADKFAPYHRSSDGFGWGDIFSDFLKDVAKGGRALNDWQENIFNEPAPDELIDEARAFLEKLKGLPTNYFEIKMQRAMSLGEFTAALVPNDLPADARAILTDAGLQLVDYDRKAENGRQAALQQVGGKVFFQSAYHGSPHLFDKFSTSAIGTGEGAQAFGWGLYFAGRKEIAEHYRKVLSDETYRTADGQSWSPDSLQHLNIRVMARRNGTDLQATIDQAKAKLADTEMRAADIATLEDLIARGGIEPAKGRLYEVEIPDDDEYLLWDKPLSEQPEKVKAALLEVYEDADPESDDYDANELGQSVYTRLQEKFAAVARKRVRDGEYVADTNGWAQKEASLALHNAGIAGIKYLDGGSRVDGEGSFNYVVFDENRVSIRAYEQNTGSGPRGSVQFPMAGVGNGDTIIRLSERADLSTFLHESGHYFLTVMQDMAARGEQSAAAEYAAIKGWWRENAEAVAADARKAFPDLAITADHVTAAIDTGTSGDAAIDAALDVGMQEQWARGFEAYVMEGKAPSAELRSAFERFRAWLLSIYRKLTGLNVNVSDDLRRVFDRMLATDEEIANAQADSGGTAPLFATAEEMGLTPEEFDRFTKLRLQAEEEAKARLLAETMAPIRREREKWYREERAAVRETVEREVNAYRQYRAIEWMGNRRWLGEGQPEAMPDMRLSKDVLVERYGAGILKTLPRGKYPVYAVEGGVDPDEAAGWFGFDSGDQMIRAMETATPRNEAIDAETEKRMRDLHGDVLRDGSVEEIALDVVHNDKRGEWLAAELKAVVEVAGTDNGMTAKEARVVARQTINRMRVRDAMAANRFLAAERKAGQEAARLGAILAREGVWMGNARRRIATKARAALREDGTVDAVAGQIDRANASTGNYNETVAKLIEAKRRQLLNHALYSEARKVTDEVGKAERFVAKLNKASKREKIAGAGRRENAQIDYLGAIDEILDRYDFRRMSGRAEDRRGSLLAFVEAMKVAGREREVAIPEAVLSEAARVPYKTLPVETLRGVIDSLKNLEHVALRWNDLIDAQNRREFEATVGDVVGEFEANVDRRPPGRVGTTGEKLRNAGRQFIDLVLNATTILREIDGFRDMGGAYQAIKAPIDAAMNRLTIRKRQAALDLESLYDVYSRPERRAMSVRKFIPALGYSLSKWEMISVALNTGNEGNYQRLTDPRVRGSLSEDQVQAVLDTLDERDAKFVQSVWDYLETFRPDIAARERRATGVEPEWVEAKPVTIAGKELKGGYYPLRYDPRLSSLARDDAENDIATAMQAGRFGKAQTRNGHLQSRAQSSGRDVQLDMSVLHRHVNQVVYDLELSEPVANSWRVLQAAPVRDQFIQTGRQADFDALETWLKDVAEGQLGAADWMGSAARTLKSNFTAAKLAFNLATVAMQITGLSQTMVVVGKRDFLRGLQASFRMGIGDEIAAKSAFMLERQTTFNKDITDFYDDPKLGPVASRWGDFKREIMGPASFWLMTKVQWTIVDIPTWLAGYEKGLRKFGGDEAQAIAYADGIVKRAQSSGLFSDRSAIERGSVSRNTRQNDVIRLFTTLGSYMFAKFNVAYERSAVAARTIRDEGVSVRAAQEALSWSFDMAFLFTLEAVIGAAIKGGLPDDDDEDKDGWAKFVAKQTAFSVMGTIPFIRDGASALQGFDGGGAYGSAIDTMVKAGKGAYNVLTAPFTESGEVKRTDIKAIINGTGLATGLPATQINRAVDASWRQAEGEDVSPLEYILGKPPKK